MGERHDNLKNLGNLGITFVSKLGQCSGLSIYKKMSESQTKAGNQRKFENLKKNENLKF